MKRRFGSAAILLALLGTSRVAAQDPQGVRLGLEYQAQYQPGLVVLPFAASGGTADAASSLRQILRQDLDFSDRFEMREATGAATVGPVNADLWRQRGADWVVSGEVRPRPGGVALRVALHDVVYGQVKGEQTFALPAAGADGFRMAAHAVADEVVRWATGDPGMAASRIAFVLQGRGSKEIYLVDSDGENLRRVTSDGSIALSPAWSPDGRRIAYTSFRGRVPALYERDLATGRDRTLSDRAGLNITPAYGPDGETLAFATTMDGNTEVVTYDRERGCCLEAQTRGRRFDSLSPTFSPDGRRIAFVSNRLGEPQVYVAPLGGEPRLISPYTYGASGYSTSPDWSPRGALVAYHTRVDGVPQIALADLESGRSRLLTAQASNEDPSWAPDGRHVVFASPNRDGGGLFVLDTVSGRVRPLVRGRGYGLPDWSPKLMRLEAASVGR